MPQFEYQAVDISGRSLKERVDAASESDAMRLLSERHLTVVDLRLVQGGGKGESASAPSTLGQSVSIPTQVVLNFYEQLSFLLAAGIPVYQCVSMLTDSLGHAKLSSVLRRVQFELSDGTPLSAALQRYPKSFPLLHTNLIAIGEKSGNLDEALNQLVDLVNEQQEIRSKVIAAAAYPLFLLTLSSSLVVGLLFFIFPQFEEIFKSFNVALPPLTQFLIEASKWMRTEIFALTSWCAVLGTAIVFFFRSDQTSEIRDKFFLSLPLIRDVYISVFVAMFSKTMSNLLHSGIPLLDGLAICQETLQGRLKYKFFEHLIKIVKEGDPMTKGMDNSPLIPKLAHQLLLVGEKTGQLDGMMARVFGFYKKRYNEMLDKTAAVLQPVLLFFAAGLIAVVAISLFVPLFKLGASMHQGE